MFLHNSVLCKALGLKLKFRPVECRVFDVNGPQVTLMRFTFHVFWKEKGGAPPCRAPLRAVSNRHDLFISKSPHRRRPSERFGGGGGRIAPMLPNHHNDRPEKLQTHPAAARSSRFDVA